jgi:hypothetical protein
MVVGLVTLFFLLVLTVFFVVLIVRGFIFFPLESVEKGRKTAFIKYEFSVYFSVFVLIFELANLTGFSWQRMHVVSDRELIDKAINRAYHDIYKNAAELKADYSHFEPKVRYWGSWYWEMDSDLWDKLLGFTRYQVLLPDTVVILDVAGKPLFTRSPTECGFGDRGCPDVLPDNPEQGIVGTLQLGPPYYQPALAEDIAIEWDGEVADDMKTWGLKTKDKTYIKDHCFSAYIKSSKPYKLKVTAKRQEMVTINQGYGFYLVSIKEPNVYGLMRISKEVFLRSQHCDEGVRQEWPNVGGGGWVR